MEPLSLCKCDWFLKDDETKIIFNHLLTVNEKIKMSLVCVHWYHLANSFESGKTLLESACLNHSGKPWMPLYKIFKDKIYLVFVDYSNSMNDKVFEKQIEVPIKPTDVQLEPKTRLEIAKNKALEVTKPLIPLMGKKVVYCGQFALDCKFKQVISMDEVINYFNDCQVNRTATVISTLYQKINEIYNAAKAELKFEDYKVEITILSDFDCRPCDLKFDKFDTDIRFIRIDNVARSLIFQNEFINLLQPASQGIEDSTDDTVDLEIDIDQFDLIDEELIENPPKRKSVKEVIDTSSTAIIFTDVDDEVPLRPLKKQKTNEASNFGTKWS